MEAIEQKIRTVVLLGEGNFSYALARVRLHLAKVAAKKDCSNHVLRMVATSFDSQAELFQKYPESVQVLQKMEQLSAREHNLLSV